MNLSLIIVDIIPTISSDTFLENRVCVFSFRSLQIHLYLIYLKLQKHVVDKIDNKIINNKPATISINQNLKNIFPRTNSGFHLRAKFFDSRKIKFKFLRDCTSTSCWIERNELKTIIKVDSRLPRDKYRTRMYNTNLGGILIIISTDWFIPFTSALARRDFLPNREHACRFRVIALINHSIPS